MMLAQASGQAINLTAIIVALIGTAGAVLSFVQAKSVRKEQRRMESRTAEAEAYERARKFDMETVDSIRKEVERLQGLLSEERQSNSDLRRQAVALGEIEGQLAEIRRALESEKRTSRSLRQQVSAMEERIRDMRERLTSYLDGRAGRDVLHRLVDEADELLTDGPD